MVSKKKSYNFPVPLISGLYPPMRKNNSLSVFPGSMASGKVSSRSKNDPLSVSNDKFEVGTSNENRYRTSARPSHRDRREYFTFIHVVKVLHFEIGLGRGTAPGTRRDFKLIV